MFVTVLPMSDPNYVCAPKLNHTITFLELMSRVVTMFVTVLPMSDPNYVCAPKLNHTITFLELMSRVVTIITGGGMSFSDNQKYCGDFIFSGHTMILLLCFLVVR